MIKRIFLLSIFCIALGCGISNALAVQQTLSEEASVKIINDIQDLKSAVAKQSSWRNPTVLSPIITALGGWALAFYTLWFSRKDRNRDRQINEQDKETDRKLTERARQLDLYKAVYPEKVKAATSLMDKAGKLFIELRAYYAGAQDKEQAVILGTELKELLLQAQAYEFLLGEEIIKLISEFRIVCTSAFLQQEKEYRTPAFLLEEGGIWAHEPSYKQLTAAVRRILHLGTLEILLASPPAPELKKSPESKVV